MHAAALKMHEVVDEVAKLLAMEQGKPLAHAKIEAQRVAENLEYFAGLADKIRGDYIPLDDPSKFGITMRRPVGVVAAITPWNFPLTLFANKLCPALATGCTIVLKPASTTPLATQRAIEAINSAGFPPGVINTVHGSGSEIGDALVSHPKINKIAFTGQTATGKRIMQLAAKNVTRVTLELGGSDAMIVADDADIRRATAAAAIGRFFNAGQACLAVKRIFLFEQDRRGVHDQVHRARAEGVEGRRAVRGRHEDGPAAHRAAARRGGVAGRRRGEARREGARRRQASRRRGVREGLV